TLRVPSGYTYSQWFWEPLHLKWHILGLIPGIRLLPVGLGLVAAGLLQVFFLKVTFRIAVAIFVIHWLLNLVALVLLTFLTAITLGFLGQAPLPVGSQGVLARQETQRSSKRALDTAAEPSARPVVSIQVMSDQEVAQDKVTRFQRRARENLASLRDHL